MTTFLKYFCYIYTFLTILPLIAASILIAWSAWENKHFSKRLDEKLKNSDW